MNEAKQVPFVSLTDMMKGGVVELVDEEIRRVVRNIKDHNFPATGKREIVLHLTFKPNELREAGNIGIHVETKLANKVAHEFKMFFEVRDGKVLTAEEHATQSPLFDKSTKGPNLRAVNEGE